MDPATFRRHGHELVEWIAEYLGHPEKYPVLPRVKPRDIVSALPAQAPEEGEPIIGNIRAVWSREVNGRPAIEHAAATATAQIGAHHAPIMTRDALSSAKVSVGVWRRATGDNPGAT